MAKFNISPELKQQVRFAARHPITWWKGADLPEEQLRPWEGGIYFVQEVTDGFQRGFRNMRRWIYVGTAEEGNEAEHNLVTPLMNTVHELVGFTFDALTDVPLGIHMDQKQYPLGFLRKIIRFEGTFNPITQLLTLFSFGLNPTQRVISWTVVWMLHSVIGTANNVARDKLWAGVSPHTEVRGKMQLWRSLGYTVGSLFTGMRNIFMSLRNELGITDYQIMVVGATVFLPTLILGRWLPSFAKQRVDFTQQLNADGETDTHERKLKLREMFGVVKHNRWFIMWTIIGLIRIFTPYTNPAFLYRFRIGTINVFGRELGAEGLMTIKDLVFGWPAFIAAPLAIQAVKWFRGPINFIRVDVVVIIVTHLSSFFVGYHSFPRLIYLWTMELIRGFFEQWRDVPHNMVSFEMFDYVEWKTGHRSEGMQAAVYGIINKFVRNNANSIVDGFIMEWTGFRGWEIPKERQPERFLNSIWPLLHLGIVAAEVITLVALLWFKRPHDPDEVERDLIERRALVAEQIKLKEELEV